MNIQIYYKNIDSIINKLNDFQQSSPDTNIFQSALFFSFFTKLRNYQPVLLTALNDDEEIIGSLLAAVIKEPGIKSYFSRRCIVFDGPVVKDNDAAIVTFILENLKKSVARQVIYTEFRNLRNMNHFKEIFAGAGYNYKEHLNFRVQTTDLETAWKGVNNSKRRQINKSLKAGAEIIEAENREQVRRFYEILEDLYKTKIKKPLPGWDFFEFFYENENLGKYLLIRYNTEIIGGIMCPIYNGIIYEWYIAGKDRIHKDIYPSVLATWAAIEYGANNGLKYFDFMGAGKPNDDYGVRDFKAKFGGELVEYGRFIRVNKPILYNIGKLGLKIMEKIK